MHLQCSLWTIIISVWYQFAAKAQYRRDVSNCFLATWPPGMCNIYNDLWLRIKYWATKATSSEAGYSAIKTHLGTPYCFSSSRFVLLQYSNAHHQPGQHLPLSWYPVLHHNSPHSSHTVVWVCIILKTHCSSLPRLPYNLPQTVTSNCRWWLGKWDYIELEGTGDRWLVWTWCIEGPVSTRAVRQELK